MHPAYSVIVFTVLSGAGYGLLSTGLLLSLLGLAPQSWGFVWSALVFGSALTVIGLASSTLHLGRPERAWRAFSQWRSSWLSREAVAAVASFVPILTTAVLYFIGSQYWAISAIIMSLAALFTVYCTSMIYASLRPIPAWSQLDVPVIFLVISVTSGVVLSYLVAVLAGGSSSVLAVIVVLLLIVTGVLKSRYWDRLAHIGLPASAASAVGMPGAKSVRLLEPPHTAPNYLQREMGYRLARKHRQKFRRGFFGLLAATTLLATLASISGPIGASASLTIATMTLFTALFIERWLFFAEARHTVTLYYGGGQ